MKVRTDLAIESKELYHENSEEEISGVAVEKYEINDISVTSIQVLNETGSAFMDKPIGSYITIETPEIEHSDGDMKYRCSQVVADEIKKLVKINKDSKILIVGLGNHNITPDALGPKTASKILVTRHLFLLYGRGDDKLADVSVIIPGVMGNTGIESLDMIKGVVKQIQPDLVIAIDALAARNINRVTTTIQMSDAGVSPGAGVGNCRRGINKETLGVAVVAIGVPTVISSSSIIHDVLSVHGKEIDVNSFATERFVRMLPDDMIVTPGNIDAVISEFAKVISTGINLAVHDGLTQEELASYLN